MAITKILARKGRLDVGIRYVLNGDKTQEQILTARLNCDPCHECRQMLETKLAVGKEGGVQYYHLIQSFQPGEVTPELALEIAREFAEDTWNGDVKISPLEGTYLQWIDFRRLEPDAEKLRQKMLYQAHVAMDEGSMFGPEGNGFERLNLAAPRNLIEEIMDRIAAVLR